MKIVIIMLFVFLYVSDLWAGNNKNDIFKCDGILPQKALTKTIKGKKTIEPDGIISEESYTKLVDTKGKCFKISASELVYLIDRDQAIYRVFTDDSLNPWLMIDFHKASAPYNGFTGVVKGVGKYTYKDHKGIPRKIPYMIVIK